MADTFAYCRAELPKWNTISISGYHMAEAGATPVQEIAFTLANAKEYVTAALASGLAVDTDDGRRVVVGVNKFTIEQEEPYEPLRVDPGIADAQAERLRALRAGRDQAAAGKAVDAVRSAADGTGNVLPPMRDALRAGATLGEICDALRAVWSVYQPSDAG